MVLKWVALRPRRESSLASLITDSWNQLVEWLKRIEALREWVHRNPECSLDT